MNVSFEGIGQWAATFACDDNVERGQVVKMTDNGIVGPCGANDAFCGMAAFTAGDGTACSVILGGMVTASYSGTAPSVGWANLSADGNGGVKVNSDGRAYLVVAVDSISKTATFAL